MTMHQLKSWPEFFTAIQSGTKTHDVRRMDRNFKVGDILLYREFDPAANRLTGRAVKANITYMTAGHIPCALSRDALHPDFCILSIKRVEAAE